MPTIPPLHTMAKPYSIATGLRSLLSSYLRPTCLQFSPIQPRPRSQPIESQARSFSNTSTSQSWLMPQNVDSRKGRRGRIHVATGGSTRCTTVVWGDYGLRMKDHGRRLSALQLRNGEDTIRRRLRGMKYRLYMRVSCGTPVYKKGNEVRMGGGKGSFDHWASKIRVSAILFEIKGEIHEKVARDAFRLAAAKMPGTYEFVKKTDPPVMGITKMTPEFVQELIDSKHKLPFKLQQMREESKRGSDAIIVDTLASSTKQSAVPVWSEASLPAPVPISASP